MKKIIKIIILIMIFLLSGFFVGCSNNGKNSNYSVETVSLPDGIVYTHSIKNIRDKKMILVGEDSNGNVSCFCSKNGGKEWNKLYDFTKSLFNDGDEFYVQKAAIDEKGNVIAYYTVYTKELKSKMDKYYAKNSVDEDTEKEFDKETQYKTVLYDLSGNASLINIDKDELKQCSIFRCNNEKVFIKSVSSNEISEIDKSTGKVMKKISFDDSEINNFNVYNNLLIINCTDKVYKYNISSDKNEEVKVLRNYASAISDIYINSEKNIAFYNQQGLYKYTLGASKPTKILGSKSKIFSKTTGEIENMIFTKNNDFVVLINGDNDSYIMSLKHNANSNRKTITIFSLYDNENIDKMIKEYEVKNPNINIEYEIGIDNSEKDSKTKTDVIKTLNTELSAGKGPDILILDGLPSDIYGRDGLLEDLGDIIDKDSYFKNVYNAYSSDSKIYSFPLYMKIPVIIGMNKDVSNVVDLNSLKKAVNENSKNEDKLLNVSDSKGLIYNLYYSCYKSWINDDNTINEEKLKEFLTDTKSIYNDNLKTLSNDIINKNKANSNSMKKQYNSEEDFYKDSYMYGDFNYIEEKLTKNNYKYTLSYLSNIDDILELNSMVGSETNYSIWTGQNGNYFIPETSMAISSKSKKKSLAKDLFKYILKQSATENNNSNCISTNKNVFYKNAVSDKNITINMQCNDDDGNVYSYDYNYMTKEEADRLISNIENEKLAVTEDDEVLEKISDIMVDYIDGKKELNETINAIKDKLDVYLAEK